MHWIYLIHEFHNLSWITEINELFYDILIYWDAPIYIYIYIQMLLILTCSQMFFFCYLFVFYWIRYLHHRWILMTFFKLFSSESAVPTSDVQLHWYSMVKQAPWLLIMFFSSWIHGKKQQTLKYQVWFTCFTCWTESVFRNDSKSVHISVVRSVCTIPRLRWDPWARHRSPNCSPGAEIWLPTAPGVCSLLWVCTWMG